MADDMQQTPPTPQTDTGAGQITGGQAQGADATAQGNQGAATPTAPATLLGGAAPTAQGEQTQTPPTDGKGQAQPDDWTLDVPQGMDADYIKQLEQGCKQIGMTKEQSEKIVAQRQREADEWQRTQVNWQREIMNDSEFGGAKFQQSITDARRALRYADPTGALTNLLETSQYGNNPDVVKALARVGALLTEDKINTAQAGGGVKPLEERLFGKMN